MEAEGLMARELEGILEQESPGTRMKLVPVLPTDLPGTKTLFAAVPPKRLGGTLSVNPYCNIQENGSCCSNDVTIVNQWSTRAPAATTTATTKKTMVEKIPLKRSAALYEENSSIFFYFAELRCKNIRNSHSRKRETLQQ